ncbi:MAG: polymer-forming cytoskeletal protein [Betaproteobacteria bacterium]
MLNFNRGPGSPDPKDAGKFALKPALYEPPVNNPASGSGAARATANTTNAASPAPAPAARETAAPAAATPQASGASPMSGMNEVNPGSKLAVGINIKLRGVEISDCDALVIEGLVEATVHSKMMEIAKPGKLTGTANIDIAEIHGDFSGELTARTRLVIHGTGRVSGTIRYGKLVVAEGGELSGDVKRIDDGQSHGQGHAQAQAQASHGQASPGQASHGQAPSAPRVDGRPAMPAVPGVARSA